MSKSNSKRRKELRFLTKGINILNKDYKDKSFNFDIVERSNIIFIVNGGLATGIDNVTILELFHLSEINVNKIIMVPGKQYSFVIVNDEAEAQNTINIFSGVVCVKGNNNPLYMCCINKVPLVENRMSYECPPGLTVVEKFISQEEEKMLANLIEWDRKPESKQEGSMLKQRDVRHFGYEFDYSSNLVHKVPPLNCSFPPELYEICERIVKNKYMEEMPDQITVNRYLPGQGIPPHVDTHSAFTDEILSLSILGDILMDFRNENDFNTGSKIEKREKYFLVYLPARSLCIMTGQSRYLFSHGITARKTDIIPGETGENMILKRRTERISFTFRKVRSGSCHCFYPLKCDSQNYGKMPKGCIKKEASNGYDHYGKNCVILERDHVLNVYEEIADHFDQTRHKPWPKVLKFVESLQMGSLLLDVGCGNGKYMSENKNIFSLGVDNCQNLLHICREKVFEVSLSSCLSLPFQNNVFDAVICIAVIHHLSSQERRKKAMEEIIRILRVKGQGLVYVWALEQRRGKKLSSYLKQNKCNSGEDKSDSFHSDGEKVSMHDNCGSHSQENDVFKDNFQLPIHQNRTDFVKQDMLVPWKKKGEETANGGKGELIFNRYYHVFKEGELEDLVSGFKSVKILSSYYDEGNWCISFQKTSQT